MKLSSFPLTSAFFHQLQPLSLENYFLYYIFYLPAFSLFCTNLGGSCSSLLYLFGSSIPLIYCLFKGIVASYSLLLLGLLSELYNLLHSSHFLPHHCHSNILICPDVLKWSVSLSLYCSFPFLEFFCIKTLSFFSICCLYRATLFLSAFKVDQIVICFYISSSASFYFRNTMLPFLCKPCINYIMVNMILSHSVECHVITDAFFLSICSILSL